MISIAVKGIGLIITVTQLCNSAPPLKWDRDHQNLFLKPNGPASEHGMSLNENNLATATSSIQTSQSSAHAFVPPGEEGIQWDKDHQHPKPIGRTNKGAASPDRTDSHLKTDWYAHAQERIQNAIVRAQRMSDLHKAAKNVIIIMGDGMGVSTTSAARIFMSQERNLTGDEAQLSWERMPYAAFSKTYSTNYQVADSGATATAMLCGEKTSNDHICVNQNVTYQNCSTMAGNHLKSILHHSIDEGKWTGVVSTARITHASPACTYAHAADRHWESDADLPDDARGMCTDIASQLVDEELNQNIRVILGGGRRSFIPENETDREYPEVTGDRQDGRNLIQEWQNIKRDSNLDDYEYKYVDRLSDFNAVDEDSIQYLMGLFEHDHMHYEVDRAEDKFGEPSLSEMVEKAIKILQRGSKGYFLFVESGRIDHAHHDGHAKRALLDTVEMSDAVQTALEMTSEEDTLLVVTADHSHVFTMAGYMESNTDILTYDLGTVGADLKFFGSLGYTNGPGYEDHRIDADGNQQPRMNLLGMKANMTDKEYRLDAGIWKSSETHGGEDVGIYARGPMAHLFHGTQEQSYIANVMMYASCVGRNKELCEEGVQALCPISSQSSHRHTPWIMIILANLSAALYIKCIS